MIVMSTTPVTDAMWWLMEHIKGTERWEIFDEEMKGEKEVTVKNANRIEREDGEITS
jgi:hypothetical protein